MSPSTENVGDEKVIHMTFQAIIIIIYLIITLIELPFNHTVYVITAIILWYNSAV